MLDYRSCKQRGVLIYQLKNSIYHLAGKEIGRIYSPLFNHTFEF
jgi:hypothetical protein